MNHGPKSRAVRVIEACCVIARMSECAENTTRTFMSQPMHEVHGFLGGKMEAAGMTVSIDAMGNLRGLLRGATEAKGRLLIGSHLDTVPDAGAFDGVLGVVLAIELVRGLGNQSLDFDVEVIGFSEEEGVRFGVPFLGSRALTGNVNAELLQRVDKAGTTVEQAIRDFGLEPERMDEAAIDASAFAYVEFHIEQGPVLGGLAADASAGHRGGTVLGVVEAIAGQTRVAVSFVGRANHAGTTPMHLRRDALAGAAEWLLAVERLAQATEGMVATVGELTVVPGVGNVIPGEARLSLDVRHASDDARIGALEQLQSAAKEIASRRWLDLQWGLRVEQRAVAMSVPLGLQLEAAVVATGAIAHRMVSGAGHDATVIAAKVPAAMLFLPSPGGISHHPDEAVRVEDVQAAIEAGLYFLDHLQRP